MVTLEQVRQLETKVGKAIEYVNRVSAENKLLQEENNLLRGKLEGSLKRVDELEESVQRFKEDQGRIEEGIIAALDRLNQFEDAIGKSLSSVQALVTSGKDTPEDSSGTPLDTSPVQPFASSEPVAVPGEDASPEDEPPETSGSLDTDGTGAGELDIF
ncbi:hypothetical protein AGMMS49944_06480 [Spirochaetia bacterium]|nr:hypothetical protein AGMMS49944_06480 [Spirochaetia bacterium]